MKSIRETSATVPYYKLNKLYEQYSVPSFINRRTLANHVRDNQLVFSRRSYFQRIIYLAKHKTVIEPHRIKEPFNKIIKEIYKYPMDDGRLGGLLVGHDMYSVHMLEGSDELIGNYFQLLAKISDELFEKSRVVLVYNNINQVGVLTRFLGDLMERKKPKELTNFHIFRDSLRKSSGD